MRDGRLARDGRIDPLPERRVGEISERQGLAGAEIGEAFELRAFGRERAATEARAHAFEKRDVAQIGRIVAEAAEMDAVALGEMTEYPPGADLVALVRRIGNALRQKKKLFHARMGVRRR